MPLTVGAGATPIAPTPSPSLRQGREMPRFCLPQRGEARERQLAGWGDFYF